MPHGSNEANQASDMPMGDLVHAVQQLSKDEAQKEEERAAEKIKQMMHSLSVMHVMRRGVAKPHRQDDDALDQSRKDQAEAEVPLSGDQEQRTSVEITSSGNSGGIDATQDATVDTEAGNSSKIQIPKKDTMLIEIGLPKVVDAQTTPSDRRFFKSSKDPEPEGDFVYEILYQHQRGAFFLGTPNFSSKSLLPVDPDEWTNQDFKTSAMDTSDFAVPDPSWEWVHKSWLVDMTGDVDEDGWEYAMTFHGSPWHGNYEVFRSFARRRRWIRLRKRKGKMVGKPSPLPERTYVTSALPKTWTKPDVSDSRLNSPSPFPSDEAIADEALQENVAGSTPEPKPVDLFKIMKKARSDREKLAYAAQYVVRYPGQLDDLEQRLDRYLSLLDFETSRREFLSLLAAYSGPRKDAILKTASKLEFYSDRKGLHPAVDA
ncbi:hypothetical protein BGZ58_004465 [Dissophora ornata]|nr:hypothetical protein BGZ58_004465 [Dissophora ornata]